MVQASYVIETHPGAASRVALRMLDIRSLELRGGDGRSWIECVVHASSALAVEAILTLLAREDEGIRGFWPGSGSGVATSSASTA